MCLSPLVGRSGVGVCSHVTRTEDAAHRGHSGGWVSFQFKARVGHGVQVVGFLNRLHQVIIITGLNKLCEALKMASDADRA